MRSGHAGFVRISISALLGEEELRRGLGVLEERRENLEGCLADFSWDDWGRLDSVKCRSNAEVKQLHAKEIVPCEK